VNPGGCGLLQIVHRRFQPLASEFLPASHAERTTDVIIHVIQRITDRVIITILIKNASKVLKIQI
jgi:hypothetical protein